MPEIAKEKDQTILNRYKRIPENSYAITIQFNSKKERDDCIKDEDFRNTYGDFAKLLLNYDNSSIEIVRFDVLVRFKNSILTVKYGCWRVDRV